MELQTQNNKIVINGAIKSVTDAQQIIDALKSLNSNNIYLIINDSFQIPSSVLGFLVKLHNENKNVYIETNSEILYELLEDLNLTSTLNVKLVN